MPLNFPDRHIVRRILALAGWWRDEDLGRDAEFWHLRFRAIGPANAEAQKLSYYETIRKYVEHEDNLINSRTTWSLTIQGFLFTAFALLAGHIPELIKSNTKLGTDVPTSITLFGMLLVLDGMAAVGMTTASASYDAIAAAHRAITSLDQIAHATILADSLPPHTAPNADVTITPSHFGGFLLLPRAIGGGAPRQKYSRSRGFVLHHRSARDGTSVAFHLRRDCSRGDPRCRADYRTLRG